MPIAARAADTAEPPPPLVGVGAVEPEMPIAAIVAGPTTPSTSSPLRAWNAFTAARVCGPNAPSADRPSFFWTAIVTLWLGFGPESLLPCSSREPPPSAPRVCGPTIPSTIRPLRCWKAITAAFVAGPNTPSAEIPSWLWIAETAGPLEP